MTARLAAALLAWTAFAAAAQGQGEAPPLVQAPPAATSPGAPPPGDGPAPGAQVVVGLKDGQTLRGTLISRDAAGLVLDLGGGTRVNVVASQVEELRAEAGGSRPGWMGDANRTRYLYSPSGFMLKQREAYFSQTELLFSSLAFGVTDFLTLGLGCAVPALFAKDGANLVGTLKLGVSAGEYVHLAAGTQLLWLPGVDSGASVGFVFGTVTVGTPDLHLGVSVGPPIAIGSSASKVGDLLFSVSGSWRVARSLALVTENWFFPSATTTEAKMVNALAARILGEHIAVDLGFLRVPGSSVPIPWLDFTYNFH